jgi:hypothetical protein
MAGPARMMKIYAAALLPEGEVMSREGGQSIRRNFQSKGIIPGPCSLPNIHVHSAARDGMAPRIGGRVNKMLIWMEIGIMFLFYC